MVFKEIKGLLNLIRVRQWYKNLVVGLALIFSGNLSNVEMLLTIGLAFVCLSLTSSSYYIINDLKDLNRDRLHPEKRYRPLASGIFRSWQAVLLALALFIGTLIIAWQINLEFFLAVIILFGLNQIYTFFLKKIMFADILAISTLFVIRAIAGALAISVYISPWLVLCPFFLALFMVVGKRRADLRILKENEQVDKIKKSGILTDYTLEITNSLMNISTALLVISYGLYSFLSEENSLMLTLPFALFVIFQYYALIISGSVIARQPEKVIKNPRLLIGVILWLGVTFALIYW